ncbi:glycosyltransferase family 4 protein [uncultured Paludibaculum sp.]|uniref:glycosyltransferase family 4 protein n=1 Tax=uncultured Paludibaculum sp. TaxID=1765020 RepID=UPI002AAA71A6|nr:glycosyltransferase family 4 protein [uncultured Paludibaculum sp.]
MKSNRTLVLTSRFPFPVIGGDRLRVYHVCKALAQESRLTLLTICQSQEEVDAQQPEHLFDEIHKVYLPKWKSYWNTLRALPTTRPFQLAYYDSAEFRARVDSLLPTHHRVWAHLIRTGQYIEHARGIRRILEMTDAVSLNYERFSGLAGARDPRKYIYALEQRRLKRYEQSVISQFDSTWLISRVDKDYLGPDDASRVEVIPNGVDTSQLRFRLPEKGNAIAFIGNLVSAQNLDACHHFIHDVLPLVRRHVNAVFRIVGNIPDGAAASFRRVHGVEVTGRVESIADAVDGAICAVCPVRAGAGMQNKVLEYLALGLPCVTSPIGLEGIAAKPGRDLLVYHSARHAADQIVRLFQDEPLRRSLAFAGRRLVSNEYSWERTYASVRSAVQELTPKLRASA